MRWVRSWRAFLVVLIVAAVAFAARAQELDEHLKLLEPLLNKSWVGGYVDSPQDRDVEITMRWEPILKGNAVRRRIEVPAIPYSAETYFYWDGNESRVAFLTLNTRGISSSGTAAKEGEVLVLRGLILWPDRLTEFRTTLEVLPDGKLRDLYYRLENGEWKQGHHQEFVADAFLGYKPPG